MIRQPRITGRHPAVDEARDRLVANLPAYERRVDLAGISTAVLEGGEGDPLVLLHGQGEFAATWGPVLPALAATHRVVVPDLPGHGASGIGDGMLDERRVAAWLGELLDDACRDVTPVLSGRLLGGAIAMRFAVERGERLRGFVLVDSMGLAPYRPSPGFALAMVRFIARPTPRSRDRMFERCFVDHDQVRQRTGELWDPLAAYGLERARSPELKAAMRRLMPRVGVPAIPPEDLNRIVAPVTLIHGRHDLQVPIRVAERASARHGWPLHVIEGAADDPAVEQPDEFLRAFYAALGTTDERTS
jgi:pimeloyl-ACP methyl ester carboxylesterase